MNNCAHRHKMDLAALLLSHFPRLTILAFTCISASAHGESVLVGALEDVPGVYFGEPNSNKVRTLFSHDNSGWVPFTSNCPNQECLKNITSEYPKKVDWFVTIDGKQIGKVTAQTPEEFKFYNHIGHQTIVSDTAPVIGKASYEFSGFLGREVHRPLITASKPYYKDPERWKRIKATSTLRPQGMKLLNKWVSKICKDIGEEYIEVVPYKYKENDLKIRAHRSKSGWIVMGVSLDDAYYCEGGAGDGLLDTQTFAINPKGEAQYLGPGLTLVDAGDYDNDGHTEVVFALDTYNRGGYVLFSDNFTSSVRFVFGYH